MSKSIRYNPRSKLSPREAQRLDALEHDLLKMAPEDAAKWVQDNAKTLPQMRAIVCDLVKSLNALAHEVRRQK